MPLYPGPRSNQVKSTTVTARTFNTASTTFVDVTGLSVTITPTSVSNKVLVTVTIHGGADGACSSFFQLMRDGVHIGDGGEAEGFMQILDPIYPYSTTIQFLDSPASVAALVYNLRMKVQASFTATGGTITTSGAYTIHTFTSSGTFTPSNSGTVEVLVVGGGGGGGGWGGGGGGGGLLYSAAHAVTAQGYSITVGAGGAKGTSAYTTGTSGGNSSFSTLTATGGGGGGAWPAQAGLAGGSGGGGSGTGTFGLGTAGQGNNGGPAPGTTQSTPYLGHGGGGGAGAAGSAGSGVTGGAGGVGLEYSISGSATYYAGGGGGHSPGEGNAATAPGGLGGGGRGGNYYNPANALDGTANTGGGGGGNWGGDGIRLIGNGGSGIVIIRYPTVPTFYLNRRGSDDTLQGVSTITVREVK